MIKQIEQCRIVPVAAVDTLENGLKLCESLSEAGLPVIEITFRTAIAAELIAAASREFPEMAIGAGTVLISDDLQKAVDGGAQFAVAPGTNPTVLEKALSYEGFEFYPGVCSPSDIELAYSLGAKTLKFFPAEAAGGVKMLKSLCGPYGHLGIKFCPTGGINATNMTDYLAIKDVIAIGGSWMVSKDLFGAWDKLKSITRDAVAIAQMKEAS